MIHDLANNVHVAFIEFANNLLVPLHENVWTVSAVLDDKFYHQVNENGILRQPYNDFPINQA
jgi:hypothetical protein